MNIKKRVLRNSIIQNSLALLATIYIYIVKITSKIEYENLSIPENYWKNNKPFILVFWHNQLMTITFSWKSHKKLNIVASGHSDGRFGAIIAKYLNANNLPTYSENKKNSMRPIFEILKTNNYIAITPDGPRGPKEKCSDGVIKIASKTNVPIIPVGYFASKKFNLNSWDSFLITLPFSKSFFVWGEPIMIPEKLDQKDILNFQHTLENKINECITKAKINLG
tara:strand:+ start:1012 stop:1680 length:669 start_codon:yes stop_codon:yes gene_type:complete